VVTGFARWLSASSPLRWAGFAIACASVIAASSYPGSSGGGSASAILAFLMGLGHFPLYGLLALATAGALRIEPGARPRAAAAVVVFVGVVGWLDEWHQSLQPLRDASLWDIGADLLGAAMALTAAAWSSHGLGLRVRLLPLSGLACVAFGWTLLSTFGPILRPPLP
jgi:VanZ family protein